MCKAVGSILSTFQEMGGEAVRDQRDQKFWDWVSSRFYL